MALTRYEQETFLNFKEASVYTHNKALRRKPKKLAQERPGECRLFKTFHDGRAVEYYIPKSWVKINPSRILTAEQRESMAEGARKRSLSQKGKAIPLP